MAACNKSRKKISKQRQCCLCLLKRPHTWMSDDFPVPSREALYIYLIPVTKLQQAQDWLSDWISILKKHSSSDLKLVRISFQVKQGCVSNLQSIPKEGRKRQGLSVSVGQALHRTFHRKTEYVTEYGREMGSEKHTVLTPAIWRKSNYLLLCVYRPCYT